MCAVPCSMQFVFYSGIQMNYFMLKLLQFSENCKNSKTFLLKTFMGYKINACVYACLTLYVGMYST